MEFSRESKFYDLYPNSRIREYLEKNGIKPKQFAEQLNNSTDNDSKKITTEAVRQWVEGYSRPDPAKIPTIAKLMGCTCDYLFGVDRFPTKAEEETFLLFDLTEKATQRLSSYRDECNFGKDVSKGYTAQLVLDLLSDILESDPKELEELAFRCSRWKDSAKMSALSNEEDLTKEEFEYHKQNLISARYMIISEVDCLMRMKEEKINLQARLTEKLATHANTED